MRILKSTTAATMKAAVVTTTTMAMEMDATTHTNTPARDRYPRSTINAAQSSYASATVSPARKLIQNHKLSWMSDRAV